MPVSRAPTLSSAMNRNGPTSARAAPSPTPGRFGSSTRGKPDFSQSVNGLAMGRKLGFTPKSGPGKSYGMETIRAGSALEIRPPQDEGDELGMTDNLVRSSGESYASGSGQSNARGSREDHGISDDGAARYRTRLLEQDKQLKEQAQSLAEMEASLAELYARAPEPATKTLTFPTEGEDGDVLQLRRMLREKNEKIAILSAEFDSHRADFRSTIDTLELASSETERVYERRVKELEAELDAVSKKNVGLDVGAFTKQMRQLEDLVQELEEGLEDARRGEAEARGEVEFLRGEVERGRSELRRERELAANLQKRNSQLVQEKQQRTSSGASLEDKLSKAGARESKEVEQKDDEIRGLKAIIHSLSRDGIPDSRSSPPREGSSVRSSFYGKANGVPKHEGETLREKQIRQKHEREVRELRNIIDQKTERETEMDRESETLKRANMLSPTSSAAASTERGPTVSFSTPTGHTRKASLTPMSNHQNQPNMRNSFSLSHRDSTRDSKGTTVSWRDPTFETNAPPEGVLPRPPSFPNGTRLGDVAGSLNAQQDRQASRGRKGPTFAEKRASVLNGFTAASSETEFEPDNISGEEREGEEGTDVEADGTPWCEICEAKGHDILSCGMFTGGAAGGGGVPSGHAERTQNGATSTPPPAQQQQQQQTPTHVRQPSAVPMALKTSASKGSVHTPELPQAGPRSAPPSGPLPSTPAHGADQKGHMEPAGVTEEMVAGKSSGRVDPGKWCALCEKDGHDSVDCPAEMDF